MTVMGLVTSQYFAGFLFLWWFRLDPREAQPITVIRYAYYYGSRADVRRRAWLASGAGLALIAFAALPAYLPKRRALHGDARFATPREIARAGLFAEEGIVLGRLGGWGPFGGRYLILGGQLSASLTAQPRAGKGVSVVIPTLLSWSESVVCTDIKKENWSVSAGFRKSLV